MTMFEKTKKRGRRKGRKGDQKKSSDISMDYGFGLTGNVVGKGKRGGEAEPSYG